MPNLKKINLLKELIIVDNNELSQALTSNKKFGIVVDGSIKYSPFETKDIFIYQGKFSPALVRVQNKQELLGPNYQIEQEKESILIKANNAWQDIINYNLPNCDYANTSDSGVNEFGDEKMEDMSWMIIDFDVTYKEMITFLEKNVEITLLCMQGDEPSQFSSIGYFDNISAAQNTFYDFCQSVIVDKLANDADYTYDYLDEDQIEAVEYFKAK